MVPRSELLSRVGEDEDEEAQPVEDTQDDPETEEKADKLMERVQEIMQEADANGEDPTEKLREVIGAGLAKQIVEGYQQAHRDS